MDDKTRLLSRVPLFAQLDGKALARVATLVDEVDVDAGTVLMTEGRTGREFFVIVDGSVQVSKGGQDVKLLGPGDFVGEIALIDNGPRTATATATSACRLLVLAHREFDSLLADHADVRTAILAAIAQRLRELDRLAT